MSSYYDDASLMLLASGGAQKDGKVYSVKPVPVYGAELVTNGDFATDSDWTKGTGTTISGGTANFSNATGVSLYQNIGTQSGSVKVTFSVTNYTSGTLNVYSGGNESVGTINVAANSVGIYSANINRSGGNANIIFGSSNNFTGSIDNVSFKEVIVSDGDFTFTRGSNLSATRVNASQLIEKGRENLLLQSNQFDTTWSPAGVTLTGGQTGYDGSSDAWKMEKGASAYRRVSQSVSLGGVQTISVYAKANTQDVVSLWCDGTSTDPAVAFNLTSLSWVYGSSNYIDRGYESVGNGWYRVWMSYINTISQVRIYVGWNDSDAGSIYIQDAQLEQGLVATSVIETGASTAQAGILENTPRLDYSGGATCPSLLLEPSRTNLLAQSEYYNTYWSLARATINDNDTTSPEGKDNASALVENNTLSSHPLYKENISVNSSASYTVSVFIKKGSRNYFRINPTNGGSSVYFNINTGVVHSGTGKIESYGNDWFRCSTTWTTTGTNQAVYIEPSLDGSSASYLGNGSTAIYIYGAQLELGSYATSYIPTYGVSQTRAGELCSNLSLTTSTDFTIFFEAKDFCLINGSTGGSYDNVQFVFSGDGAPYSANGSFHIYNNTLYYYSGSTAQGFGLIYNNQTDSKFVIMKRGDKVLAFANGSKITEATLPSGADAKVINWDAINLTSSLQDGQGDVFGSKYQQLLKFDTALSDLDLAILTGATTYNTFAAMALALNYTVYE